MTYRNAVSNLGLKNIREFLMNVTTTKVDRSSIRISTLLSNMRKGCYNHWRNSAVTAGEKLKPTCITERRFQIRQTILAVYCWNFEMLWHKNTAAFAIWTAKESLVTGSFTETSRWPIRLAD